MFDERSPGGSRAEVSGLDPESTFSLVERARSGDREALERLLERHLTPLRRWARGRLPGWARDALDTDDLVQDVLLRTFRRVEGMEIHGPGALQAYLREAVLNRVRDEIRRKARRPVTTELGGHETDGRRSPLEEAIGREAVARYERALAALSPADREAIIGRVEMGYSFEALAEVLGKPTADAARKAAQRALVRLARHMDVPAT